MKRFAVLAALSFIQAAIYSGPAAASRLELLESILRLFGRTASEAPHAAPLPPPQAPSSSGVADWVPYIGLNAARRALRKASEDETPPQSHSLDQPGQWTPELHAVGCQTEDIDLGRWVQLHLGPMDLVIAVQEPAGREPHFLERFHQASISTPWILNENEAAGSSPLLRVLTLHGESWTVVAFPQGSLLFLGLPDAVSDSEPQFVADWLCRELELIRMAWWYRRLSKSQEPSLAPFQRWEDGPHRY